MPSTEDTPLIEPTDLPQTHRKRRFGIACLLLMIFWQGWAHSFSHGLGAIVSTADKYLAFNDTATILGIGTCVLYLLPVLMGLYTDLFAGRYKALGFGLGVKVSGSFLSLLLTLVVVIAYNQPEKLHKLLAMMAALYSVGGLLSYIGFLLIVPITITSMIQRQGLTFHQISTKIRWGIYVFLLGRGLSLLLLDYFVNHKPDYGTPKYKTTIDYGVMLECDVLSVALFLLGRAQYSLATTIEGEKSGREMWRRVKTWLCGSGSTEPQSFLESASSNEIEQRIEETIDKQKIRKAILFMAIQSTIAVSTIAISFFFALGQHFYRDWEPRIAKHKINGSSVIASVCLIPILEILFWKVGHRLESGARQLTFIGVIMCLAAIGVIVGGAVHQHHISIYWLVPVYTLMGITAVLIASSALTLCYMVSPRGLETFTIYLMINLPLLFYMLQGIIAIALGKKQITCMEEICYIIGGITLAVILGIYLPVCRWFLKADATIKEMKELREGAAGEEEP